MKLLLDTHVFLWYVLGDARFPPAYRVAVTDPANNVYLSVVSIWEAAIKHQLGKLPLPSPAVQFLVHQRIAHRFESLSVEEGAIEFLEKLPLLHRDPFDRLLVAQAMQHKFTLLSLDPNVAAYGVPVLPR
jgi:PIN domain nuclease of toxin-antitoxin system